MADLERLITDKFTINSAGKTPQQRRLDSLAMAYSSKMAPHAIDFTDGVARDGTVAGFLQKTGNDRSINTFLTSNSIFGIKNRLASAHKDSFYKAGSFFDCESNPELGDNGMMEQSDSSNLFENETNFQFGTDQLNVEECTDLLFNVADIEKTNSTNYPKLRNKQTKYKIDEDKENNAFVVDKNNIKCAELRSPLNEINIRDRGLVPNKVNHFKTFVSQNSGVSKFTSVYDGLAGIGGVTKVAAGGRARRRMSEAELGSPLKRKTGGFSACNDDGRTPSKFSVVLNSLSAMPGNVSTSSPYTATPSKSPPCKRRSFSSLEPCQMSSDSGCGTMSCNSDRNRRTRKKSIARGSVYPDIIVNTESMQRNFQDDDLSESARHFDIVGSSRLTPLSEDVIVQTQQNLSDYELDALPNLDEALEPCDRNTDMNCSLSNYEIICTDSPNILRVAGASYNNLEFGSPIGDCETSETFGSCRKPVTNYGRKMPERTETTRMLNFDIDSSANSTFQFTPPTIKAPVRHSFDFGIRNSSYECSPKSDIKTRPGLCGFSPKNPAKSDVYNISAKNDTTPNKQGDSFSFGMKSLADQYSFVDSGVPNWNDSPISSGNSRKTESIPIVPGSRRSRLFNSMSTNSIESASCISEMEDCMLFDMESNNCIEDVMDEGVDVNYAVPQSLGALISSEIKTEGWGGDDDRKDSTPSREGFNVSLKRPLFRRCFSLTPESEASNAIERVRVNLFKGPAGGRSPHVTLSAACTPTDHTRTAFKRPEAPSDTSSSDGSAGKRRRKSSCFSLLASHYENDENQHGGLLAEGDDVRSNTKPGGVVRARPLLQRALSENCSMLKTSLVDIESYNMPDMIGDFSMPFILPLTTSQHQDLKAINGETLAMLIQGHYKDTIQQFQVIDCRYPYEYSGGHIVGAENLFTEDLIRSRLLGMSTDDAVDQRMFGDSGALNGVPSPVGSLESADNKGRRVLVFHCEFSSERGPKLCRFLRTVDRDIHKDSYPRLHHPELYVLRGGYRSFHQRHADLCRPTPGAYTSMMDPKHLNSMKAHRTAASRSKYNTRIGR